MVNPSSLPKRGKKKNKKSKRRNPELLIVNPYSLDEDKEKKRAKMAKRKAKKRKKSRRKTKRRRKNPLSRRRRKNPGLEDIKTEFLGENLENVKTAALMAVGGGLALAVGTAAFGSRLGAGNVGKGLVAVLSGVVGGVVVKKLGEVTGSEFLSSAAVPGAMGAMVLGLWSIAQPLVEPWADKINAKLGFAAGLGSYIKEFQDDGSSGLGVTYYDEYTAGVSPGMDGWLGQPVTAGNPDEDLCGTPAGKKNPFCAPGMGAYEPLGDIYNNQRLGSFEAEPGFGGFVPETANPRDQQVADEMKHAAGHYGNYGSYEMGNEPFEIVDGIYGV